jgi:Na+/H+-dicarboxylate symporter
MGGVLSRLLLNPVLVLASLAAAVLFGFSSPALASALEPLGGYYLSLLKVVVLPYLFSAIMSGIAHIAADPASRRYLGRIVVVCILAMITAALVGLAAGFVFPPAGQVSGVALAALGDIVNGSSARRFVTDTVVTLSSGSGAPAGTGDNFFENFIPENIFLALSSGDTIKVVLFCAVFGAALSRHLDHGGRTLLGLLQVVQLTSAEIIRGLNLLLPFALFAMISSQVAHVGVGPLISLGGFLLAQLAAAVGLVGISLLLIAQRTGLSPVAAAVRLGDVMMQALTTRSSIACIPQAVDAMTHRLGFARSVTELVLPLCIAINRIGPIFYYVIGAMFIAQIYGVMLEPQEWGILVVAAIGAGIASSGGTGPITVLLIGLVAEPLKLPIEAAVVLFIAVDPIVDALRTVVQVVGNCAVSALIVPVPEKSTDLATASGTATS